MKQIFKNQRGDTILEVLISIAVLSLALSSSYALANRSSQAVRQAHERGESSKITQGEIEKLKLYLSVPDSANTVAEGRAFCIKFDNSDPANPKPVAEVFTSNPPASAQNESETSFNNYPTACKTGEFYRTFIMREGNTYTAHTRWFAVTGNGKDESTMVYRVYPDSIAINGGGPVQGNPCPINTYDNGFECVPCSEDFPANYFSNGGGATECEPIPPTINVRVWKIPLTSSSGDRTPSCSSTSLVPKSGVTVQLNNGGGSSTTDGNSIAKFEGLDWSTTYTASVTIPSRYEMCSPPPSTATATTPQDPETTNPRGVGAGSVQAATPELKIRPRCTGTTVDPPQPPSTPNPGWIYQYTARWAWDDQTRNPPPPDYTNGWGQPAKWFTQVMAPGSYADNYHWTYGVWGVNGQWMTGFYDHFYWGVVSWTTYPDPPPVTTYSCPS